MSVDERLAAEDDAKAHQGSIDRKAYRVEPRVLAAARGLDAALPPFNFKYCDWRARNTVTGGPGRAEAPPTADRPMEQLPNRNDLGISICGAQA
jgi:hypothetical protein